MAYGMMADGMPEPRDMHAMGRLCVFTTLIGGYEELNEQPVAARSAIPFVCLTDDPALSSASWQIRLVKPLFPMDPIRSQRELKIRPHIHLPDFDSSLYIDNSVLLTLPPEHLIEQCFSTSLFCLPLHSFRQSLLDEFLEVSKLGKDDQGRIFEQLNHYLVDFPEILKERPYSTGLLFRRHNDARVKAVQEIWASHVHRYSRRDQLSLNIVFAQAGFTPDTLAIDNFSSWFHSWPHAREREELKGTRLPAASLAPPSARIRALEQALAEHRRRSRELVASTTWQRGQRLERYMQAHPALTRLGLGSLRLARRAVGSVVRSLSTRPAELAGTGRQTSPALAPPKATIYIDPGDQRGVELVRNNGNLNPATLAIWRKLLTDRSWTHIVDIGANYGEMLVNVDLPSGSRVTAVEPNPRILPYLELTLAQAGVDAEIVRSAIANFVGSAPLVVDEKWSGKTHLATRKGANSEDEPAALEVPTTTLTALLHSMGDVSAMRALVKIDVGGYEAEILEGVLPILGELERFVALVEVLRVEKPGLQWLVEHFDLELYDLENDALVSPGPQTAEQLEELLAGSRFHAQDVVVHPKPV